MNLLMGAERQHHDRLAFGLSREVAMRKLILPMLAVALLTAAAAWSTPAAAVDGEAAAAACEKRPKHCSVDYGDKGDLIISVCNDGEACRQITCPPKGSCGFPAPKGGGKPVGGNVTNILAGPSGVPAKQTTTPKKLGTQVDVKKIDAATDQDRNSGARQNQGQIKLQKTDMPLAESRRPSENIRNENNRNGGGGSRQH
jgi:hypothetical protein